MRVVENAGALTLAIYALAISLDALKAEETRIQIIMNLMLSVVLPLLLVWTADFVADLRKSKGTGLVMRLLGWGLLIICVATRF